MQSQQKFIRLTQVQEIVPYSASQIWRLEKKGTFPSRVRLGENRVAWLTSEINEWVQVRLNARNEN